MNRQIADCINILGNFCGKRDIEALTLEQLQARYGIMQADVMVLFGGSILCGGDILGDAMKHNIAKNYVIVGGAGHTTETLRQTVHRAHPRIITEGLPEAEVFNLYLKSVYGMEADYLETRSTNCGNNITLLLDLLERNSIMFKHIVLCQDATMQYRMEAGLRKYVPEDTIIINYAVYHTSVTLHDGQLSYVSTPYGMWDMDRYIQLLMGEIPRLTDTKDGYGPRGKNFIAHVDIPDDVTRAFEELKKVYAGNIREANPLYASV